jgi:hypothetical protein
MPEVQETVDKVQEKLSTGSGKSALTAAAAAAATTAATYAVRKRFSHDHEGDGERSGANGSSNGSKSKKKDAPGLLSSAAATSWDAASDVLLPLADDAAEAAGKYVATHGPEILRERIIPKFIEAFNEAK